MCKKNKTIWCKQTAINLAIDWHNITGEHVGVVENIPGDYNFFAIQSITQGVTIHFRTDEDL